ncbi:MAG: hypothetical protein ABIJ56_03120 [Pseudomonadota bacterium]
MSTSSRSAALFALLLACAPHGCGGTVVAGDVAVTVEPLQGKQGEELTLMIRGAGTDFLQRPLHVTFVEGGEGLSLGPVNADNADRARCSLSIREDAPPDERHKLQVTTGERAFRFDFRVIEVIKPPKAYFDPAGLLQGYQGNNPVRIVGTNTHFREGRTRVDFPEDAKISMTGEVDVNSPTSANVLIRTAEDSPPGTYPATITTDTERVGTTFTIYSSDVPIMRIEPESILQGSSETVLLTVENMEILEEDLNVAFPYNPGLEVSAVERLSDAAAVAEVSAADDAVIGLTPIRLKSGGKEANSQMRVVPTSSSAPFVRLYPSIVSRGAAGVELQIQGYRTHLVDGVTEVDFDPPGGLSWGDVTVLPAGTDKAIVILDVDGDAPTGTRIVTVTTGEETARGSITVAETSGASVNAGPTSAAQGDCDVTLTLSAVGFSFTEGAVVDSLPGSGILIKEENIVSDAQMEVIICVSPTAPTGSTLLMVQDPERVLGAPFTVAPSEGTPYFTISPPYASIPSQDAALAFSGTGTQWSGDSFSLAVSDPSISVQSFEVENDESATAQVSIPSWIDARRCVFYIYSSGSITAAWLSLIKKPYRNVTLMSGPVSRGAEEETLTVQGVGTGFINGLTRAEVLYGSLGGPEDVPEGMIIDGLTVINSVTAVLTYSVYSSSEPGSIALLFATGAEEGFAMLEISPETAEPPITIWPRSAVAGDDSARTTISLAGDDFEFVEGEVWVGPASPEIEGLHIPDPSVKDLGQSLEILLISTEDMADTSVPIVIEAGMMVFRRHFSFTRTDEPPLFSVLTTDVRKGQEAAIAIQVVGPINLEANPPDEIDDSEIDGVTVSGMEYDASQILIDVLIDENAEDDIFWFPIRCEACDETYDWNVAVYAFEALPQADITDPESPFASGSKSVATTISVHGVDISEEMPPDVASVSGNAFVRDSSFLDPDTVEAVFDYPIASSDIESEAFLSMTGTTGGAVRIPLKISAADIQTTEVIPSLISGMIPLDAPRYIGFTVAADDRVLFSLQPEDREEKISYELVSLATPPADPTGINRFSNTASSYFVMPSGPDGDAAYYVSIGGEEDFGKDYVLSLQAMPWADEDEDEGNNDNIATAQPMKIEGEFLLIKGSLETEKYDDAFDVDYYGTGSIRAGTCGQVVSTGMAPSNFQYPYVGMALLDGETEELLESILGNAAGDGMDPVLCTETEGTYYFRLESVAGTQGAYYLFLRPEVVVNELFFDLPDESFVELHCANIGGCGGHLFQVFDMADGEETASVDIDAFPEDGYLVLGESGDSEHVDLVLPALGFLPAAFCLKACNTASGLCDAVQVGGDAECGEGAAVLDPGEAAWQRLWNVDTDDNRADFSRSVMSTPGHANHR